MAYEGREETRVKNSREGKGEKLMSKVALNASEMMSSCGKNHMPALTLKSALPLIGCEITPSLMMARGSSLIARERVNGKAGCHLARPLMQPEAGPGD